MCATQHGLSRTERCGKGAIAPRRSMAESVRPRLLPHHRAHAQSAADTLLTGHDLYDDKAARLPNGKQRTAPFFVQRSMRLSSIACAPATNGGWALATRGFKRQIARRAPAGGHSCQGRPSKAKAQRQQSSLLWTPILPNSLLIGSRTTFGTWGRSFKSCHFDQSARMAIRRNILAARRCSPATTRR